MNFWTWYSLLRDLFCSLLINLANQMNPLCNIYLPFGALRFLSVSPMVSSSHEQADVDFSTWIVLATMSCIRAGFSCSHSLNSKDLRTSSSINFLKRIKKNTLYSGSLPPQLLERSRWQRPWVKKSIWPRYRLELTSEVFFINWIDKNFCKANSPQQKKNIKLNF